MSNELVRLDHILSDRSREPIKTFLTALLARNTERAVAWLQQRKRFEYKAYEAVGDLIPVFAVYLSSHVLFGLVSNVFRRGSDRWARSEFLRMMTDQLKDDARIWQLIREAATQDTDRYVRRKALELLVSRRGEDPTTWQLIREAATQDPEGYVRGEALTLLARGQREDPATWQLIREAAITDTDKDVRSGACGLLLDVSNCDEL